MKKTICYRGHWLLPLWLPYLAIFQLCGAFHTKNATRYGYLQVTTSLLGHEVGLSVPPRYIPLSFTDLRSAVFYLTSSNSLWIILVTLFILMVLCLWIISKDTSQKIEIRRINNKDSLFSTLPFGILILNSCTMQRGRLDMLENAHIVLQPSYEGNSGVSFFFPTVWYKCLQAKVPVTPDLLMHEKTVPIYPTTLRVDRKLLVKSPVP